MKSASRSEIFLSLRLYVFFSGSLECIEIRSQCPLRAEEQARHARRRTRRKRNRREQSETQSKNLRLRTKKNENVQKTCIKESARSVTHSERNEFLKRQDVPRSSENKKKKLCRRKIIQSESEAKSNHTNQKCRHTQVNTACRASTASTRTSTTLRSWPSHPNTGSERSSSPS